MLAMYLLLSSLRLHQILLIINVSASTLKGLVRASIMIALECRLATASFCGRVDNVPRLSITTTTRTSAGGTVHNTVLPICVPFCCVALSVQADKSNSASISWVASTVLWNGRNDTPSIDTTVPVLADINTNLAHSTRTNAGSANNIAFTRVLDVLSRTKRVTLVSVRPAIASAHWVVTQVAHCGLMHTVSLLLRDTERAVTIPNTTELVSRASVRIVIIERALCGTSALSTVLDIHSRGSGVAVT